MLRATIAFNCAAWKALKLLPIIISKFASNFYFHCGPRARGGWPKAAALITGMLINPIAYVTLPSLSPLPLYVRQFLLAICQPVSPCLSRWPLANCQRTLNFALSCSRTNFGYCILRMTWNPIGIGYAWLSHRFLVLHIIMRCMPQSGLADCHKWLHSLHVPRHIARYISPSLSPSLPSLLLANQMWASSTHLAL